MVKIYILTLFPNIFDTFIDYSIVKKAIMNKKVSLEIINIRDFSNSKNKQVDDTPYGGGPGMVLMLEPILNALKKIKSKKSKTILLSPQGKVLTQNISKELSLSVSELILICGHYEGFDERIRKYIDLEISIGDYILTGGEIAAMVLSETIIRLLPNVIKNDSHLNDSFADGLLDYPVFTKPYDFNGDKVPEVLVNGNHKLIKEWREYHSIKNTYIKRPDLLERYKLSDKQKKILSNIKKSLSIKKIKNKKED